MYAHMQELDLLQRKVFSGTARAAAPAVHHDHGPHRHGACACGGGCPKCQSNAHASQDLGSFLPRHAEADAPHRTAASPIIGEESHASGRPLDRETRSFMESRFGHDFGDVRVHTYDAANRSADAIGAMAYASGNQIVFGSGQYRPETRDGKELLAHELVHTLQRRSSSGATQMMTPESHPAEVEARTISKSVVGGRTASPVRTMSALSPRAVSLQVSPRGWYCALHAAVCLGLSENPPAAVLCWSNFAIRCGGGVASNGAPGGGGGTAVAAGPAGGAGGESAGMPA